MSVLVALQGASGAALAGVSAGQATVAGVLTTGIPLAGVVAATSTTVGALTTGIPLAGVSAAVSTTAGALTTAIPLSGASIATSTASGALTTGIPLVAVVTATSSLTGALTVGGAVLAGVVTAVSTTTGALTTTLPNGRQRGHYRMLVEQMEDEDKEVVAKSLHTALLDRYGEELGRQVYRGMEAEQKGPFAPDRKYARDTDGQLRDFIRKNANRSR